MNELSPLWTAVTIML